MLIRVEAALELLAQRLGVKLWPLGGVDFPPVGETLFGTFQRTAKPVDVDGGKSLSSEVVAAPTIGALTTAVAPDKGGVLFAVLWEAVVGRDAGVDSFESTYFEGNEARGDAVLFPFLVNLDFKGLGGGVIAAPESLGVLRDLLRGLIRSEAITGEGI